MAVLPDDLCALGSFESREKRESGERERERAHFVGENCGRLSLAADVRERDKMDWDRWISLWHKRNRTGSHFRNAMESHKFRVNLALLVVVVVVASNERHSSMSVALPLGHEERHRHT